MVEIVNFVLNFPKAYLQLDVLSLVSSHLSLDRSLKFKQSQNLMTVTITFMSIESFRVAFENSYMNHRPNLVQTTSTS